MADVATGAAVPQAPAYWPFDGGNSEPKAPDFDPNNPETWSGDQRVNFLGQQGLTWIGGQGDAAVWQAPNGMRLPESSWFDQAFGTYQATNQKDAKGKTIYKQVGPPKGIDSTPTQNKAADRVTSGGVVYERSADGTWKPAVGLPTDQSAGMANVGLGYAQLENTKAQAAVQAQQWKQTFQQTTVNADRAYQQQAEQLQQAGMVNMYNIAFNDKKQAFAESSDNKHLAQQATQMGQDLAYKQADIQLKQQTLDYQYQTFNAQAANEALRFNAQQQLAVQQATAQFESQKQDRLANIATQAGALAQDSGDRGKLAATLTANSGWGQANAATSGTDFRTADSKTPLESLLRTRKQVQAGQSPYTFTPVTPERIGAPTPVPTLAGLMGGGAPAPATPAAPAQPTTGIDYSPAAMQARIDASRAAKSGAGGGAAAAAGGGFLSNAMRQVGERGPELQLDLADGTTVIMNQKQQAALAKAGLDLKGGAQKYADGGVFGSAFSNVNDSNRDLSTGFLSDAYQRAVSGTPWANGQQLPSPVYLSSPNTDPNVASLVGSLKALGEGVPANETSYLANLYKPNGIRDTLLHPAGVVGRSR